MYDRKSCLNINFKSTKTRENFFYNIPIWTVTGNRECFEKEARKNLKEIIDDSDGFHQDGFNKEGFDRSGSDQMVSTRKKN